jgi:DNA-binding transcriptional regulator GbsR (MarR family)
MAASADISVMTEISDHIDEMPPAIQRFVLQWGDLGGQWGVNRSIAQIQALLYITERPLTAEEIADTLGIARSNVSNSLRELLSWRLVRRVPIAGDRRDHFVGETDVWAIAMRIAAMRKEREIDPATATLTACLAEAKGSAAVSAEQRARLERMLEFNNAMERWYAQMLTVPTGTLSKLVRLGGRVVSLLRLSKSNS